MPDALRGDRQRGRDQEKACYAQASQNPDFFYRLQDTVAQFRGLAGGYKRTEAYIMQTGSSLNVFTNASCQALVPSISAGVPSSLVQNRQLAHRTGIRRA